MRLTEHQRRIIQEAAKDLFGGDAEVRVFGSRADDSARGGDIDLLIKTRLNEADAVVRAELAFQARLQEALGEQKIDVLVDYPGRQYYPPVYEVAERTGVPV